MKKLSAIILIVSLLLCSFAFAEQDHRAMRSEVISIEGLDETITTDYCPSNLGYAIWVDRQTFWMPTEISEALFDRFTSEANPSQDYRVEIHRAEAFFDKALPFSYDEMVQAMQYHLSEFPPLDVQEVDMTDIFPEKRARGFLYINQDYVEHYIVLDASDNAFVIYIRYPREAAEGFGARALHMLKSFEVLPSYDPQLRRGQENWGYVLCESITLRDEPNANANAISTLYYGDYMEITSKHENWLYVLSFHNDTAFLGWVNGEYVLVNPAFLAVEPGTPVYTSPNADAKRVGLTDKAMSLAIISELDDYYLVSFRGAVGYIKR